MGWRSTATRPPDNWPPCRATRNTDAARPLNAFLVWGNPCRQESKPRSAPAAQLPAAPSRAPWPIPSRPTRTRHRQNAATTGAAPPAVPEPSSRPSAPHSCAHPAVSARCNSRAAGQSDPRARARSKAPEHTPKIGFRLSLRSSDSCQHLRAKPESSQIVDSRRRCLRPSDSVRLAGIDDAHHFRVDNIEKAALQIPHGEFSILLSHTPEIYRQAAHADFNLLLSGHTHGGQICLPGSIPIILDSVLPRRMGAGAWQYQNMCGYTSVGAGSSVVPVRLNCSPVITLYCLRRG